MGWNGLTKFSEREAKKGPSMTNKKMLLYTAFSLSLVSVFSRLLGFLREMVIAWRFGAGAGVDAYVAAMAVPQILVGIITGALGATFLPVYSSERAAGRGACGHDVFRDDFYLGCGRCFGLLVCAAVSARAGRQFFA